MIFKQPSPPGGSRLSDWCASLAERLKNAFAAIDDENISSLSAQKLTGTLELPLTCGNVSVTADGISVTSNGAEVLRIHEGDIYLGNEKKTEYIRLTGGHINARITSLICDEMTTGTLNGTEV